MTQRAVVGSVLAVLALGSASPAWTDPINFNLTLSSQNVANTIEPTGVMGGTVQFYSAAQGSNTFTALGGPIEIGSISLGQSFTDNLIPSDPCFGLTVCQIGVSFNVNAQATDLFNGYPALAFANSGDAPATVPPSPILPVTINLIPTEPCINGEVCMASGVIMAYDAPVQIGTWGLRSALPAFPAPSWVPVCPALSECAVAFSHGGGGRKSPEPTSGTGLLTMRKLIVAK
jgi:hypothetical protein